jgi:hypothetical protein
MRGGRRNVTVNVAVRSGPLVRRTDSKSSIEQVACRTENQSGPGHLTMLVVPKEHTRQAERGVVEWNFEEEVLNLER